MATIHDLLEVSGLAAGTTYSKSNGGLLDVVDGATSTDLDDGEFDEGDLISIGGVVYTIDLIQEPAGTGSFLLGDGSSLTFGPGAESNLDVMFLTVSNGGVTRYFVLPNDSYGNFNVQAINTGAIQDVAGNDAAVIGTTNNAIGIVCFCAGTRIAVGGGRDRAVEDLRPGDPVRTRDNGLQPVRWIGMLRFGQIDLLRNPKLRPYRIAAGALGMGRPKQDLLLSRQHRILVRSRIAKRLFCQPEVLVSAAVLAGISGIARCDAIGPMSYHHLMLDRHELVLANGCWVESLLPGSEARKVFDLGLTGHGTMPAMDGAAPKPARRLVDGREGRGLIARHLKNARPLF